MAEMMVARSRKETVSEIALFILISLLNGRAGAKIFWKIVGKHLHDAEKRAKREAVGYEAFRTMLSRLRRDGLIESEAHGIWKVTAKGKAAVRLMTGRKKAEEERIRRKSQKADTVVTFDIPEKQRMKRAYVRSELVACGFRMLQQSVWIGPGPLPKEFIAGLKDMELLSCVHIFGIARRGTISEAV